ncbi:twin-arginine translocase subunit TatB [Sphingomonas sp. AR_OL41]|uniref:twin-arginine translocase subunit TatB n=1 Tax=Sphingomonas sp. AR_OL41 TaxID=3042729 RepID=UPI00247FC7B6|nr:twin-arginine translocase subunit TatB [Sphingomonas sp. AR_OL41]MDH7971372.1 twin-arginine translocase subunit TatB [Sphingomonas sp. AR_OL41]
MFDIAPTELLLLGAVAIIVIPPKDLPKAMRVAGYWVGRARGAARQFRAGFDNIIRESELNEMEKRWAEENERIMREHPPTPAMLALDSPGEHDWTAEGGEAPVVTVEPPVVAPMVDDTGVIQAAPAVPAPEAVVKKPRTRKPPVPKPEASS